MSRTRWIGGIATTCLIGLWIGLGARASVFGRPPLKDLVDKAPVVVLAEVTAVEGLSEGDWIATARVIEVWKGPSRQFVSYGPSPTSKDGIAGDSSSARVGERAVLLLEADKRQVSHLRLAFLGRGRLPVFEVSGKELVETGAFSLPDGVTVTRAVVGDHDRELLPLGWVRGFVSETARVR